MVCIRTSSNFGLRHLAFEMHGPSAAGVIREYDADNCELFAVAYVYSVRFVSFPGSCVERVMRC